MKKKIKIPEFCLKCKNIKATGRDIVGLGWIICECDSPKAREIKAINLKPEPFIFDPHKK